MDMDSDQPKQSSLHQSPERRAKILASSPPLHLLLRSMLIQRSNWKPIRQRARVVHQMSPYFVSMSNSCFWNGPQSLVLFFATIQQDRCIFFQSCFKIEPLSSISKMIEMVCLSFSTRSSWSITFISVIPNFVTFVDPRWASIWLISLTCFILSALSSDLWVYQSGQWLPSNILFSGLPGKFWIHHSSREIAPWLIDSICSDLDKAGSCRKRWLGLKSKLSMSWKQGTSFFVAWVTTQQHCGCCSNN